MDYDEDLAKQFQKGMYDLDTTFNILFEKIQCVENENKNLKEQLRQLISQKKLVNQKGNKERHWIENEVFYDLIYTTHEWDLLSKLFSIYEQKGMDSTTFILEQLENSLDRERFDFVEICFKYLIRVPDRSELDHAKTQTCMVQVLMHVFQTEFEDLEQMDYIYMLALDFMICSIDNSYKEQIHSFLQENINWLSRNIIDANSPGIILEYLKCLIYYEFQPQLKDIFADLVNEWRFLDANININEFARFLWYSFYFDIDNVLLDVSEASKKYMMETNHLEIRLYNEYYRLNNSTTRDKRYNCKLISSMLNQSSLFDTREKIKIYNKVYDSIHNNIELDNQREKSSSNDLLIVDRIYQIRVKTEFCNHCKKSKLNKRELQVQLIKKSNKLIEQNVVFEFLYCEICNRVFVYDQMKQELYRLSKPHKVQVELDSIDYPPKNQLTYKTTIIKQTNNDLQNTIGSGNQFNWPSTFANESDGHPKGDGNFRFETELHRLGYRITGLNRIVRWDILVHRAIPNLPLKEIVYTIANNVRLRKAQVGGRRKFAYAISEWQHDLNRLKNEYFKKNFTWPQF